MKTITNNAANAFLGGRNFRRGATSVINDSGYTYLILHGSVIAKRKGGVTQVSLRGFNTVTTRERVNGLLTKLGTNIAFAQRDFKPFIIYRDSQVTAEIDAENWFYTNGELVTD